MGKLVPSGLPIEIETKVEWEAIDQVRIIPRGSCYVIEVVYQKAEKQAQVDRLVVAALDLGSTSWRPSPAAKPVSNHCSSTDTRSSTSMPPTVTSPPAKARGLPLSAERLSCFAEAGLAWFSSPHQVLRPLHRQQPRAPRPNCSVRH